MMFGPLGFAPLGDDGGEVIALSIGLQPITTGNPVVGSIGVSQTHQISLSGITTGQPVVPPLGFTQTHQINLAAITTGQPIVAPIGLTQTQIFTLLPITTGNPTIGVISLDGSNRREVHVSAPSNSVAIVTGGPNFAIVSAQSNEAA